MRQWKCFTAEMLMYSSWSLWEVGLSSLQTFSWGIISCSVFKLQGRNCKQFKGADTIFSFHFFLYIYPEDNQFISSLWKKKKTSFFHWTEAWSYTRWCLLKFHGTNDPYCISWGRISRSNGQSCHIMEVRNLGLHLSHGQELQRAQKLTELWLLQGLALLLPRLFLLPSTKHKLQVKVYQGRP